MPQAFENIFSKYDRDGRGALSLSDLVSLLHGNRCAGDPFGVCMFERHIILSSWQLIHN